MYKRALVVALAAALAACGNAPDQSAQEETAAMNAKPTEEAMESATAMTEPASDNPLLADWNTPYGVPPFDKIKDEHYGPALEEAMAVHSKEVTAIAEQGDAPTFDNTIIALERSGQLLTRAARVFFNLAGANTNDTIKATQRELAPKLSAHEDAILLNGKLFARIDSLYQQRAELGLDAESLRLLDKYYEDFVRAGARLSESEKDRLREINTELATLGTQFSQNVLNEVNDSAVVVDNREELAGLPDSSIQQMADAAAEKGLSGKYLVALQNTSGQPPLEALSNRTLRQRIMEASLARGSRGGEYDNREIVSKVMQLRAERARNIQAAHAESRPATAALK